MSHVPKRWALFAKRGKKMVKRLGYFHDRMDESPQSTLILALLEIQYFSMLAFHLQI